MIRLPSNLFYPVSGEILKSTYLTVVLLLPFFQKVHIDLSWSQHKNVVDYAQFLFLGEWAIYQGIRFLSCAQNEIMSI